MEQLNKLFVEKGITKEANFLDKPTLDAMADLFVKGKIAKDLSDFNAMLNFFVSEKKFDRLGDFVKKISTGNDKLTLLSTYLNKLSVPVSTALKISPKKDLDKEAEKLRQEAQFYNEEFKKSLELMKTLKSEKISQHYFILQEYTRLLLKSDKIFGLLIEGSTGRGKSFQILNTYMNEGREYEKDFAVLTTYISPLEFYQFCYRNKDKTIIIDDVPDLFRDKATIGIILSFLWGATEKRNVEWHSSTAKLTCPKQFNPTKDGKMIIIANRIPESIANVKSRCLNYNIEFTHSEMLEIIYEICRKTNIPLEIADFIRDNTDMTTSDDTMNLRLPIKFNEMYYHNPNNWKELAKSQLNVDKELKILKEIVFSPTSKIQQIREFMERTGHSRATFYRWKERLDREMAYQKSVSKSREIENAGVIRK